MKQEQIKSTLTTSGFTEDDSKKLDQIKNSEVTQPSTRKVKLRHSPLADGDTVRDVHPSDTLQ